jgi:imidazolonepropionase-like amidohydrolase
MSPRDFALRALCALLMAPAAAAESWAITGARLHTLGPSGVIENGTIVIRDGRIEAVGADVDVPRDAQRIDAAGKIVTPGLYDAYSYIGVVEVSLVVETNDRVQSGARYTASFRVADAINPRSTLIPVNRIEGITRAVVTPAVAAESFSSPVAGLGSVIHLGGVEDYLVARDAALYVHLGEEGAVLAGGARGLTLMKLREALQDARDFSKHRGAFETRARRQYSASRPDLEALAETLDGERPVVVSVDRASDIRTALRLADEFGLKLVVAGGAEAWMEADRLAAAQVPVILDPLENLPDHFESLGATLENAARLHAAGVTVAFATGESHNARNMRQAAGNAVAYGLPWDAALAAMTLNPARIFGLEGATGSLQAGKDADLVVWDGDPLEVTSAAERVFIRGRDIPMVSRHTLLRDRYGNDAGPLPPQYPH